MVPCYYYRSRYIVSPEHKINGGHYWCFGLSSFTTGYVGAALGDRRRGKVGKHGGRKGFEEIGKWSPRSLITLQRQAPPCCLARSACWLWFSYESIEMLRVMLVVRG